jgi:multisubunit Na+/H+ antiporter MnhG subunit
MEEQNITIEEKSEITTKVLWWFGPLGFYRYYLEQYTTAAFMTVFSIVGTMFILLWIFLIKAKNSSLIIILIIGCIMVSMPVGLWLIDITRFKTLLYYSNENYRIYKNSKKKSK